MGRTPWSATWSARVPLDPLLALEIKYLNVGDRPTRASAADRGVRPTAYAEARIWEK